MILTLDIGNSDIFGGLFVDGQFAAHFRKPTRYPTSSDELGLFLRAAIRENGHDPGLVTDVAICSVVPKIMHSVRSCCRKYFRIDPFVLQPGAKTGLQIGYRNPLDVGADRIANAIGAATRYPNRHLIVIDLGTATKFEVVKGGRHYLGGAIVPGLRISMEALESKTARLPAVEIVRTTEILGRSTVECIQSGLYFGHLATLREMTRGLQEQAFGGEPSVVLGTGGFSQLFAAARVFDAVVPDLVLLGLFRALEMNPGGSRPWSSEDTFVP